MSAVAEIEIEQYLCGRDPAQADWAELAQRLSEIPEVTRIVVWRYEDYAALRSRILAQMLPPSLAALVPEPKPANESITQEGYEWFCGAAMKDFDMDLNILIHQARNRFPRSQGYSSLRPFGDDVYRRSAEYYAENLIALARVPKVQLMTPRDP